MAAHRAPKRFLLAAILLLAGCAGPHSPTAEKAADAAPDTVEVIFLTDPATGQTDGPFDPETGLRVMTQADGNGIVRVVLDPISKRPILLDEPPASPSPPSNGSNMMAPP